MKYSIKQKTKRLKILNEKYESLLKKYDTTEFEESLKDKQEAMQYTDKNTKDEFFLTKSLNHIFNSFKSDILSLKMKVQRFKDLMKKLVVEEGDLKLKEKKISKQVSKMVSKLLREKVRVIIA